MKIWIGWCYDGNRRMDGLIGVEVVEMVVEWAVRDFVGENWVGFGWSISDCWDSLHLLIECVGSVWIVDTTMNSSWF